jgi:N-formylglutamate deformylase
MDLTNIADFKFDYDEPFVFTAIHNGHYVSENINKNLSMEEETRRREEDSNTEFFTELCSNSIIAKTSRCEFDINRTPDKAVYMKPEDSWDKKIRKRKPSKFEITQSILRYDAFYAEAKKHFDILKEKHGKFFVYDIHSYNHRRDGDTKPPAPLPYNPEIIIGTNNMPVSRANIIHDIHKDFLKYDYFGRSLNTRINIKFPGGNFSRWIHRTYPNNACCVALEFKKIFMDEWTGEYYPEIMEKLREALMSTIPKIKKNMKKAKF